MKRHMRFFVNLDVGCTVHMHIQSLEQSMCMAARNNVCNMIMGTIAVRMIALWYWLKNYSVH